MDEAKITDNKVKATDTKLETKSSSAKKVEAIKKHTLWVVVFCCLIMVICYWQKTGQMMSSAAIPSMCVCSMCAGVHVGKFQKERE